MRERALSFRLWFALVALVAGLATVRPVAADDPCVRPICKDDYRFNGERCESGPDPITLARSHYDPERPLCLEGWRVEGPNCIKIVCCEKPACEDDERYRDEYCHSGPTFFGWRSHRRAICDPGWVLNATTGICHKSDCPGSPPPPPAVAAGPEDGPLPAGRGGHEQPPPPAVAAGRDDPPPRPRPDQPAPPPPVVSPAEVTRLSPAPCVDRGGAVTIDGQGFGRRQGARRAVLGGHGISVTLRITRWSDRRITAVVPNDDRIEPGQWYYIGIQDENGYWISNLSRTITICRGLE